MLNRVAGLFGIAVMSPLLLLIALAVRLTDGSPVLFRQERAGRRGVPFEVIKFRTMRSQRFPGEADEDRMTRVGRFLRASSLDELPSLWNVVRGEMNLVGPRPLPVVYTPLYSPAQARRLEVKPGLTGLLQIRGRNALTWEDKFELDTWYVEQRNWRLDLRILAATPRAVLQRRGISHPGHVTMPVFTGSSSEPSNRIEPQNE